MIRHSGLENSRSMSTVGDRNSRGGCSMSKAARLEHRRQRQAEALRRAELARQRRRLAWAAAAVASVLVIIGGLVVLKVTAGGPGPAVADTAPASPASDGVLEAVKGVPADVLDQVGLGAVDTLPKAITGQPALTADGKPLVVYIGAEYCPYCAAQRWGWRSRCRGSAPSPGSARPSPAPSTRSRARPRSPSTARRTPASTSPSRAWRRSAACARATATRRWTPRPRRRTS